MCPLCCMHYYFKILIGLSDVKDIEISKDTEVDVMVKRVLPLSTQSFLLRKQ